jgi:hypothetical protein
MDLSDLPRVRGPLKYVGYLGVLVMMGGLAAFAFGLLSMFANFGTGNIPRGFPPIAIYGFGTAVVGGILVTIALGLGEKDDDVNIYTGPVFGDYTDVKGHIITGTHGPVYAPYIYDQRKYVGQIARSVRRLPPGPERRSAEAAVRDVHDAVEGQDPEEIADALGNLTNILNSAGNLAAAAQAIINLAGTLGTAGQSLLRWFGVA